MNLGNLRQWQWMLISILAGALLGTMRSQFGVDQQAADYSLSISQGEFESGLTNEVTGLKDGPLPQIHSIRVLRDGARYVILCMYHPGSSNSTGSIREDGRVTHRKWNPVKVVYEATDRPGSLSGLDVPSTPGRLQLLFERLNLRQPDPPGTILDHLRTVLPAGTQFQYEWYREWRIEITLWVVGCFLVVGIIWPPVANFLFFGTFFRPREEGGINLRKVKARPAVPQPKPTVTQDDMDQLLALEKELEEKLKGAGVITTGAVAPGTSAAPTPIKKLDGAPEEPVTVAPQPEEEREFAARPDDYYPTVRHKAPDKP